MEERAGHAGSVICGAEDGTRTRDPNLGKVMLYQLSHFRKKMEATTGIEPVIKALQASALPLGHVASQMRLLKRADD